MVVPLAIDFVEAMILCNFYWNTVREGRIPSTHGRCYLDNSESWIDVHIILL